MEKLGIRELINLLRDKGIPIDEKYLNSIIREINPYISEYINPIPTKFIESNIFLSELNKILKEHTYFNRTDKVLLIKLIIALFNIYNSNPTDFINVLGIERDPQGLLRMLRYENVLMKEPVFEKFVDSIKQFIKIHIACQSNKKTLLSMLEGYTNEKRSQRTEAQRIRNLKTREKLEQYGEFYHSSKIRVKSFLLMLGFSPYDGYDLWENKTKWRNQYRIWSNFHHIPYDPEGEKEEDLVHIPIVNPDDIGKEYNYLTHNYISNLESQIAKDRISEVIKAQIKQKLEDIKEIIIYNTSVIQKAVLDFNPVILNQLIGWRDRDIEKAKERLMDKDFSWSKGVEKYIPISKNDRRLTPEQTKIIIKYIQNLRNS